MTNRISGGIASIIIVSTAFAVSSSHARAQTATTAASANAVTIGPQCDGGTVVTQLGFMYGVVQNQGRDTVMYLSGYSMTKPSNDEFAFPIEPFVTRVAGSGPAAGRLQQGDRISRVNGYPITTTEGSDALRHAQPGVSLVLTVRRGDDLVPVTIGPTTGNCLPVRVGNGQGATVVPYRRAAPSGSVSMTAPVLAGGSYALSGTLLRTSPNAGWLGIGFDCSDCGQRIAPGGRVWYFTEPPIIYNVDTGSPAYNAGIRRGDLLIGVDGKDVTSSAAGVRLGQVKPGETLKLSYRRGTRTQNATLRVAPSPVAVRGSMVDSRAATELLKSTQDLRSTETESRLHELKAQLEKSRTTQEASTREIERALIEGNSKATNSSARAALGRLRATQDIQNKAQEKMLTELLRSRQEDARKLNLVELQMKRAAVSDRATLAIMGDPPKYRATSQDQRLRYSGSVGGADIEVRGPGSVSVTGDGDDLVIITGDAVIHIKTRKTRN